MIAYLTTGIVLGLSAGISPGPLLALVLSHSLQYGSREGLKVACTPLVTDMPIVAISLLAVNALARSQAILGGMTLFGALFLVYLGYENLRSHGVDASAALPRAGSLVKGTLVNALSPNPYLFWLTVGAPIAREAWLDSFVSVAAFLGAFYACLVGSKMALALVVGRSRSILSGKAHVYVLRILGVLLLLFAGALFWKGLGMTGIVF